MTFHCNFSVSRICCPRSIQATHTHAFHSEVSTRFLGQPAFQLHMFAQCDRC